MSDQLSKKLFHLNLHISNTLDIMLENDPLGSQLNHTQLAVFRHIYFHRNQEIYQRDLEKDFLLSRSTASRVLLGLESMGLIARTGVETDGRLKRLTPTPEGAALGERLQLFYRKADSYLWKGFGVDEMQAMYLMLERMQDNLQEIVRLNSKEEKR